MFHTRPIGLSVKAQKKAVAEVGRIDKTIHILTSIDDEFKRRRTLTQLNRGEDRHSLARAVFHGKRGELRQRYREGQEDQLGALGLVVNILVLWNTIYMDAVLEQLRIEGYALKPEDVARLSPLTFDNTNFLGRYAYDELLLDRGRCNRSVIIAAVELGDCRRLSWTLSLRGPAQWASILNQIFRPSQRFPLCLKSVR